MNEISNELALKKTNPNMTPKNVNILFTIFHILACCLLVLCFECHNTLKIPCHPPHTI